MTKKLLPALTLLHSTSASPCTVAEKHLGEPTVHEKCKYQMFSFFASIYGEIRKRNSSQVQLLRFADTILQKQNPNAIKNDQFYPRL